MIFYFLLSCFVILLACCWLGSFVTFCVAKLYKSPESVRFNGKVLAWLSGLVLLTGAAIWLVFFPPTILVYRTELGEFPTPDVQNLRSSSSTGHDGRDAFLQFQAAPTTITRLAENRNLLSFAPDQYKGYELGGLAPNWWEPDISVHSLVFNAGRGKTATSGESIWLVYDSQTQTAYYGYSIID